MVSEIFDWHENFNAYYLALLIKVIEMHLLVKVAFDFELPDFTFLSSSFECCISPPL